MSMFLVFQGAFLVAQMVKESTCNAGDLSSIPGLGRCPGKGKGHPLLCSGLENSMDCVVLGVTKSQTQLNDSLDFSVPSLSKQEKLMNSIESEAV